MRRPLSRTVLAAATAAACLALVAGCGSDDGPAAASAPPVSGGVTSPPATGTAGSLDVVLHDASGAEVGTVTLTPVDGAVRVEGSLHGLPAGGYHGFHIHQNPVCDPKAAGGPFSTAGGHFNPGATMHGDHAGDLPPLLVDEDGTARLQAQTDRFELDDLRAQGAAVVVHAQPDNLAHIPDRYTAQGAATPGPDERTAATGDAGDRIACGVIEKS
ncbi:superoxide dismutase family protein [Parafrankia discariae]|uniref:superoxide dismutase family protein n=1 Tax=Parafrankia discariae TaxID=365528 RepID=UPI0003AA918D|nr:superoxide dismutase family protein [Parafrankia discariae]